MFKLGLKSNHVCRHILGHATSCLCFHGRHCSDSWTEPKRSEEITANQMAGYNLGSLIFIPTHSTRPVFLVLSFQSLATSKGLDLWTKSPWHFCFAQPLFQWRTVLMHHKLSSESWYASVSPESGDSWVCQSFWGFANIKLGTILDS